MQRRLLTKEAGLTKRIHLRSKESNKGNYEDCSKAYMTYNQTGVQSKIVKSDQKKKKKCNQREGTATSLLS